MLKKLQKNNKGFTIIEVMIVLAIVGLIMLIVFLAVPSLQRNSRNTQRKNDAASISGALSTYTSNNNGKLPGLLGKNASTANLELCTVAKGGAAVGDNTICTANTNVETAKLGYFTADNVHEVTNVAAGTTFTAGPAWAATKVSKDTVTIVLKGTCNDGTTGQVDYNARTSAVVYVTEAGTGDGSIQCTDQ